MKKLKKAFRCQQCGYETGKWLGKCPDCGVWGSLIEEVITPTALTDRPILSGEKPQPVSRIKSIDKERVSTGINELDRIMGGGIVSGSATLIGGDPGIGKSTLILQVSGKLCELGKKVLYVSAEESIYQTKIRAERLGTNSDNLLLVSETNLDVIGGYVEEYNPDFLIIDSIQMIYKPQLPGTPGTVTQVRESTLELMYLAKRKSIALFLIGHVTKEGSLAGPRTLEHMVDTVLYFEGDRFQSFRILRAVKNRFGSTNEIGLFDMDKEGLQEVTNPSALFIGDHDDTSAGRVVMPTIIGTRPLLVEIQALTAPSFYSVPSRRVSGVDFNRVLMILAVLERRIGLSFSNQDVFVNVVGGVKIDEPAADLAIALAIVSSIKNKPISNETVMVGEIGLTGEVRGVNQINQRINETQRLGFKQIMMPIKNAKGLSHSPELTPVKIGSLREAISKAQLIVFRKEPEQV
ncbi:MAG: DNA repair protein RadA [Planctomycetes bacterium]|nr:DNA repair protein RadA [Planctomycetota bacterium]